MKTIRFLIKISIFMVFIQLLEFCDHKTEYRLALIRVDSIHVPVTLTAAFPFDIDFFGTIAADGCHSFSNFDIRQENGNLFIEAWSKFDGKAGACPTVMVYLTGHKVTYSIESPVIYNIKIRQPDNTLLDRQISVN